MNDDYESCDWDYMQGREAGGRAERNATASAMTEARKNASPEVQTALDALARDLSLKIKSEVSYTA